MADLHDDIGRARERLAGGSEIATMLTIRCGSPPDTGIDTWELLRTGQTR